MDFDEFEAEQEKKRVKTSEVSGCSLPDRYRDEFSSWEEYYNYYMHEGSGGAGRDYYGFRLPHRTKNEL